MRRNKGKWLKLLLLICNLLLIAALAGVFYLENRREAKTERILKKALATVQDQINTTGSGGVNSAEELAEPDAVSVPKIISVRGDSYSIPGGDNSTTYPAILQQLLYEGKSDLKVLDYTLDQRSALTHLYYAGVPAEEIEAFIDEHRSSDRVTERDKREFEVGDVSGLSLNRYDEDALPVIFMGNYGGWGQSLFELIEMQKRILATYSQQDYYIIVGTHFDGYEDVDTLDKILMGYWGAHYLGVTKIPGSTLVTEAGHRVLAERIFTKLEQIGAFSPPEEGSAILAG